MADEGVALARAGAIQSRRAVALAPGIVPPNKGETRWLSVAGGYDAAFCSGGRERFGIGPDQGLRFKFRQTMAARRYFPWRRPLGIVSLEGCFRLALRRHNAGRPGILRSGLPALLSSGRSYVLNALRGLPRLTIAPHGVTLDTSIRTKWANWDSIEPFTVQNLRAGAFSKKVLTASAKVVGPHASEGPLRAKAFAIPDHFQTSIETIVAELNAARAQAVGGSESVASPETAPTQALVGLAEFRLPWLTLALLAVLVAIFALENVLAIPPSASMQPSLATLFAMGGLSRIAILSDGEWYRLFTAPLLHANFPHILGNGVALLFGGWFLERLVGRLWFFAFFVVGALGGALVSLAVMPPSLISVGASGALMGLFAALFISSFRGALASHERVRLQINSMRFLIPALFPLFSSASTEHIDYGAHAGGALSGAVLAAVLLKFWPPTERIPQLRKVAAGILDRRRHPVCRQRRHRRRQLSEIRRRRDSEHGIAEFRGRSPGACGGSGKALSRRSAVPPLSW